MAKTDILYKLMQEKGYPEAFVRLICQEMNTEFTAGRMISYIAGTEIHNLEDTADEMLAILSERDRLVEKHKAEHAQDAINRWYRRSRG